jgi:hypothetical protein
MKTAHDIYIMFTLSFYLKYNKNENVVGSNLSDYCLYLSPE